MKLRRFFGILLALATLALSISPMDAQAAGSYYITVDITNQIVTIYSTADDTVVRQMLCSSGKYDSTPVGTFVLPKKQRQSERSEWFHFTVFDCYAKYATRIHGGVLFHSLTYEKRRENAMSKKAIAEFGRPASHGCVRLRVEDAKFIAENCLAGTQVRIFKSEKPDPDLRELLMQASFDVDNGISYNRYLGIAEEEGELGRYDEGPKVRDLQYRLRDLGVFAGDPNGAYGTDTVVAVRQMQQRLGMEVTGTANLTFQERIFAEDAPTAMDITLDVGHGGPAVRNLQQWMSNLGFYSGPMDGVYDKEVADAIRVFQTAYGYALDGIATPEIQKAIYYENGKVRMIFSRSASFDIEPDFYKMYIGRVSSSVGIRIRERSTVNSEALGRLVDGDIVIGLEHGDNWSKIRFGDCVGYVKNVFVEYYEQDMALIHYRATDSDLEYSIGCTAEDYREGATLPAEEFANYLAANGSLDAYDEMGTYVRVNTEGPDVTLNMREAPSTNSAILAVLPYGAEARVVLRSSEWTLVDYQGLNGYVLNRYIEFLTDPEEDVDIDLDDEGDEDRLYGVVRARKGKKAAVYDVDSDDATVLGHLSNGVKVEVLRTVNGWSFISYKGHTGYMKDEDLQFIADEEYLV